MLWNHSYFLQILTCMTFSHSPHHRNNESGEVNKRLVLDYGFRQIHQYFPLILVFRGTSKSPMSRARHDDVFYGIA